MLYDPGLYCLCSMSVRILGVKMEPTVYFFVLKNNTKSFSKYCKNLISLECPYLLLY